MHVDHGNRLLWLAWIGQQPSFHWCDGCERVGHFAGQTIRKYRPVGETRSVNPFGINSYDRTQFCEHLADEGKIIYIFIYGLSTTPRGIPGLVYAIRVDYDETVLVSDLIETGHGLNVHCILGITMEDKYYGHGSQAVQAGRDVEDVCPLQAAHRQGSCSVSRLQCGRRCSSRFGRGLSACRRAYQQDGSEERQQATAQAFGFSYHVPRARFFCGHIAFFSVYTVEAGTILIVIEVSSGLPSNSPAVKVIVLAALDRIVGVPTRLSKMMRMTNKENA